MSRAQGSVDEKLGLRSFNPFANTRSHHNLRAANSQALAQGQGLGFKVQG